jgi:hypothetical protein
VPEIAGQKWRVVGDDEAVDAVGDALSKNEAGDRTDVVDDERETLEPAAVGETFEEVGVPGQRVVEALGPGAATEAREVRGDPARALEERLPDPGADRVSVQVENPRRRLRSLCSPLARPS